MPGQIQHHTVPRMYLAGFADGLRLTAVNVHTGKVHGISTKDATTLRNFYALPGEVDNPNSFEDALGTVEGSAASVLTDIRAGLWPLTPTRRATFAAYLALQFMRGPDHRRQLHQVMNSELRRMATSAPDELAELMALRGAPDRMSFFSEGLPESYAVIGHLIQMSKGLRAPTEHFLVRRWRLVRFSDPALLTSDAPIVPMANPMFDDDITLGLENAHALLFPVNRTMGLQMFRPSAEHERPGRLEAVIEGDDDSSIDGQDAHLKTFNRHVVMHASERVFHHPDDDALVPKYFKELAELGGRTAFSQQVPH